MNHSASQPRLTRGAHDPKAHANNIVGLFSQIIPLLAYIGRTLNDTMCDHADPDICDRCQRKLHTLGTLISGSATTVAMWSPSRLAELNARLAIAAARRLLDTVELGHPVAWAMKGGTVLTTARRAVFAAAALLDDPDLGAMNHAQDAASQCTELDLSTSRVARKQGLVAESFIIGHLLKAASKAACAAVAATETGWAQAGETRQLRLGLAVEGHAGAAVGAALDAAALLDVDPGRAEAMMVVATGVCAEFDRIARPAAEDAPTHREYVAMHGDTANVPFGNSPSQGNAGAQCPVKWATGEPCDGCRAAAAALGARAAEDTAAKEIAAAMAADLPAGAVVLYGCDERATVDGIGYPCVKLGEHVEHETALGAVWWTVETDAVELHIVDAVALPAWLNTPTEEYNVVDDFEESELGDVADDAIGEIHQAEEVLRKVANEHRTVQSWWRKDEGGVPVEYRRDCCVSCRDAAGRPMPAPCRTAVLVSSYYTER